jgi:signal transduction histidine kinase/FixJ family two-component response regulator
MKGSGFTQMFFRRPHSEAGAADFPLEAAAWPVLIVNAQGEITRGNAFAHAVFGGADDQLPKRLVGLWTPENGCSAEQFVRQLDSGVAFVFPLKLQTTKEGSVAFVVHVSPWQQNGKKQFIFQVHTKPTPRNATPPESPAQVLSGAADPPPAAPRNGPSEETQTAPQAPDSKAEPDALKVQQKLQCALQLTRTVSMDFNNALTSIMGHATHVLGLMPADHPWRDSIQQIEKAADRATQVAFDLASFSQEEKPSDTDTAGNLSRFVRKLVDHYKGQSGSGINWRLTLESRLFSASFSESKLSQALEKILDNATEAVGDGGTVSVSTQNCELTKPQEEGSVTLPAGTYVCIEINDTGPGIPSDVLPQIIEPFFTTKPGHRGLGLAWTYGIITNHGGSVVITSPPGQGTTVRVYLPAHRKPVEDVALEDEDLRGNKTVLFVDDDALLLKMSEIVVSSFGYRVLTAANGRQALDIIERPGQQIDLVVTDLVMPHMDGYQLIRHLRQVAPGIRIVSTSGNFRTGNQELGVGYLQKPYASRDLLRVVKEAFQKPAPGEGNASTSASLTTAKNDELEVLHLGQS